jgi:hypothetical protein
MRQPCRHDASPRACTDDDVVKTFSHQKMIDAARKKSKLVRRSETKANLFAEVRPSVFAVAAFTKGSDLPFVAVANKIHAEPDDEWRQSGTFLPFFFLE